MNTPLIVLNLWRFLQVGAFFLVNSHVKDPYMDEIFHVLQAQTYCRGEFRQYDPKLTTPPGLYLISWALHQLGMPCSIGYLRLVNLFVGSILLPKLCSWIYHRRHPDAKAEDLRLAQCFAIMPLLSFFSLLYYTDLTSTYLVLLSYYFCLGDDLVWGSIVFMYPIDRMLLLIHLR